MHSIRQLLVWHFTNIINISALYSPCFTHAMIYSTECYEFETLQIYHNKRNRNWKHVYLLYLCLLSYLHEFHGKKINCYWINRPSSSLFQVYNFFSFMENEDMTSFSFSFNLQKKLGFMQLFCRL